MILYIENHTDATRKLLELIKEFSKVAGYKINTEKSFAFLYTNNEKSEGEIKEIIQPITATTTIKYLKINLNQIPYDYTVEVRNRFKGLDLIDRVHDELWNEVRDIVQETGIKTIPIEKKCKKAKWLSGEALQIAVKRREKQRRKGKI